MKAIRLASAGSPLQLTDVAEPVLRPGGVIVRVKSAPIMSFMKRVVSGELGYTMPTPFTPGANAVGMVEAVADDVFDLEPGQPVFCDPHITAASAGTTPAAILIGLTGLTPGAERLQHIWRDGTFAERILWPAQALTPIKGFSAIDYARISCVSSLAIPYGGLLRGEFRPGQTLIVNGATGRLGTAAILVALALGAGKIVAVGRDQQALTKVRQLDERRITPVILTGRHDSDVANIQATAQGADMVLDMLGGAVTPDPTLACLQALRPRGTAVWMGGVQATIPLSYAQLMLSEITIRGAFMYPRSAPAELLNMIAAGTLDLSALHINTFPLEQFNEALDYAAQSKGLEFSVFVL